MSAADIAEHKGNIIFRVNLEKQPHCFSARRAVRVFDALHPRRITRQFVACQRKSFFIQRLGFVVI
jgi:hypothetical protein